MGHTHTQEHSISLVPAPLQHPNPTMMGMIPEEEEEEESPSPAKKIRKLQNDEEEVCLEFTVHLNLVLYPHMQYVLLSTDST